jgi:hypothetical protein
MLNKLFGKKRANFYLELKETDGERPAAPAVEAPAPVGKKGAEKKAKKTSVKKERKAEPKAAPAPVATAGNNGKVEPKEVEFATKYSIDPPASRRRPGPSLNPFKEMARKAKLPLR